MGLLRNYRWLKTRDIKPYPKPDFAKLAATKSELDLLDYIRIINGVVEAFHSSRINQITTGRSRREADVIVLMNDRIVFIEVKNYKGDITMQDHVLYKTGNQEDGHLQNSKRQLVDSERFLERWVLFSRVMLLRRC